MNGSDPVGDPGLELAIDSYFAGFDEARRLFDVLRRAVEVVGGGQLRVGKSQVAFRRRRGFAWAWIPGKVLHGPVAPLVLTVALRRRDPSPRWKQVVEPYPGRFTHHLELHAVADVDDQVAAWLREAWEAAA